MYFEMGAPVLDASMVTLTGDVCAADTIERKRTASKTAGLFNEDLLIADCMMAISVQEPGSCVACRAGAGLCAYSVVSQKFIEEQQQILRLTTPRLKNTPGAPFAQDDNNFCAAYYDSSFCAAYF